MKIRGWAGPFVHFRAGGLLLLGLFCSMAASAGSGITYHGRLIQPDGITPVSSSNVEFKIQIRTPGSENCLMYEETHIKDLSQSNGVFAIGINDGTASIPNSDPFTLDRVFQNRGTFNFAGGKCSGATVYSPNVADGRKISVSFNDGTFAPGTYEPLPTQSINFVPMAIESNTVGGFNAGSMMRVVDGSGNPNSVSALSIAQHNTLMDLIAGTAPIQAAQISNSFITSTMIDTVAGSKVTGNISGNAAGFSGSLSGDVTGTQGATTVARLQGRVVDTSAPTNGQALVWDTADNRWEPGTVSGGGAVTSVAGRTGAVTLTSADVFPVQGQYTVFAGPTTPGTAAPAFRLLKISDIRNAAGTDRFLNQTGACLAGQALGHNSVVDTLECQSFSLTTASINAALGANVAHVAANPAVGQDGQSLRWNNTSGLWEWFTAGAGGGSVTSVTSANADIGIANTLTTPVLTLNSGTGANQIVKLNASSQLPAVSGVNLTDLNASNITSGTLDVARLPTSLTNGLWTESGGDIYRSSGRVGIGTSTPTFPLSFSGQSHQTIGMERRTSANSVGRDLTISAGDATVGATNKAGGYLVLKAGKSSGENPSRILFQTSPFINAYPSTTDNAQVTAMSVVGKNVGIGTDFPNARFEVLGESTWVNIADTGSSYAFLTVGGLQGTSIGREGSTGGELATGALPAAGVIGQGLGNPLHFATQSNVRMTIATSGNIGIGTITPGDKLHVEGKIRAQEICDETGANCKDISAGWGGGATSVAGDVSGPFGTTVVDAIKGKAIVPVAYATGQVLRYDGTNWVNALLNFSTDGTGTLPIARGGTGATSPSAAINNLLPTQSGQTSKILQTDGTNVLWVDTPVTGITALTGDVTASGAGSVAATIANNAVTSLKIIDATIIGADMNFTGVNTATSSLMLKDSTGKFYNFACSTTGHVPTWTVAGFACQAPSVTELDPKVGANTSNLLSKWNGTALVASGVHESSGNVGIGTTTPNATLAVNGAIRSNASVSNATSTINFETGNLQHTTNNCSAFILHNMKDGGSYTLAVKGTVSATCSFTSYSDAGTTSLTYHLPADHAATTVGKHTIYTFLVMGGDVYTSWVPGL